MHQLRFIFVFFQLVKWKKRKKTMIQKSQIISLWWTVYDIHVFFSACNKITKRLNGKWCNMVENMLMNPSHHIGSCNHHWIFMFVHLAIIKNVHCFVDVVEHVDFSGNEKLEYAMKMTCDLLGLKSCANSVTSIKRKKKKNFTGD